MKLKLLLSTLAFMLLGNVASAGEFAISFDWQDLKRCTSGHPNIVGNPQFSLSGVPSGTRWIYFKLTDLDVPGYKHGGGWIPYNGEEVTQAGVFQYKSPCPPNGTHTYEWQAMAMAVRDLTAEPLAITKSRRNYP